MKNVESSGYCNLPLYNKKVYENFSHDIFFHNTNSTDCVSTEPQKRPIREKDTKALFENPYQFSCNQGLSEDSRFSFSRMWWLSLCVVKYCVSFVCLQKAVCFHQISMSSSKSIFHIAHVPVDCRNTSISKLNLRYKS